MTPAVYQEALDAYGNRFQKFTVEQLHGGLINQTYKVTSTISGGSFLLQQINHKVFTNPEHVQHNYEMLWKYLQSEQIQFRIPEPKYFIDNTTFYCDRHENFWRVFEFIDDTEYLAVAGNIAQAKTVAETFAGFTACFKNFDTERLHITIPGFHNLSYRFRQFKESLHSKNYERLTKASLLIQELKQRERYANFYDVITESEEFPLRVMHHDAKIANILFNEETSTVVCPVDFDTTMPGYFFSDLGDMIRSMACCKDENSTDFDELCIRKDFYEAIVEGYLSLIADQLTSSEKKYIHYAGIIMFYMQALRFLADYLNGDMYYRIEYPEQNFDRSKNQLTLLQKLEEFLQLNYQFKV